MKPAALLCLGVGLSGHLYADTLWLRRLNGAPEVVDAPPPDPGLWPRARSLTVVILDGLRYDVATTLPGLRRLATGGVLRELRVDFPSFTFPGLTTLATGSPPAKSGVRLNAALPAFELDSVSARAAAAGLPVRWSGQGLDALPALLRLGPTAQESSFEQILSSPALGLRWVYLPEIDRAGHTYGAASAAYQQAAAAADGQVARIAAGLDPGQDALVVVSDHGHRDIGGHGGVEPEVLAAMLLAVGPGVVPRALPPAAMTQVAPTMSAWLGLPAPAGATAPPMRDLVGGASSDLPQATPSPARWAALPWAAAPAVRLARDLLPSVIALATTLLLLALRGYRWSWSVPRGELGFTVESLLASALGLLLASRWMRRERRAAEAGCAALLYGAPYLSCAVLAGGPAHLGDPALSFGVVAWGTLALWTCVPMGLRGVRS